MKRLVPIVLALACGALAALPTQAQSQDKATKQGAAKSLERKDANFLSDMAKADMAEVSAGKLAASKAASAEVRKYGQHMVEEHSKMLAEGGKVAKSKGVTPPSELDKKHKSAAQKLEELQGAEFDRAYMEQMVKDHEDALKLAKEAASEAKDPEVKALAQKAMPHLRKHLEMAKQLAGKAKSASAGK